MGTQHSVYHFYGAHVPREWWTEDSPYRESDRVDAVAESLGLGDKSATLGSVTAGHYDRDMLFLGVRMSGLGVEVELGEYRLSPRLPVLPEWDMALRMLAAQSGYDPTKLVCGWITVPDES